MKVPRSRRDWRTLLLRLPDASSDRLRCGTGLLALAFLAGACASLPIDRINDRRPAPALAPTPTPTSTPCPPPPVVPPCTPCPACPDPSLPPAPAPTPTPAPGPAPPPEPGPGGATCDTPVECLERGVCPWSEDVIEWVGVGNVIMRSCAPNCVREGYAGVLVNLDTTQHSREPYCWHVPGRQQCETFLPCQYGHGPSLWMRHPAWGNRWDRVDRHSSNVARFHHKPKPNELGPTDFQACPPGESPGHPKCGKTITVEVRVP